MKMYDGYYCLEDVKPQLDKKIEVVQKNGVKLLGNAINFDLHPISHPCENNPKDICLWRYVSDN